MKQLLTLLFVFGTTVNSFKITKRSLLPEEVPESVKSIDGHEPCLKPYFLHDTAGHCIPFQKPDDCDDYVWWQIALALGPEEETLAVRLAPPSYLSIEGHKDCLRTHSLGTHEEYCLPADQDEGCTDEAWIALQTDFDGVGCGLESDDDDDSSSSSSSSSEESSEEQGLQMVGLGALPPTYLQLADHVKCLGVQAGSPTHTEKCLPRLKPQDCSHKSWKVLVDTFEGDGCRLTDVEETKILLKPKDRNCLKKFQPPRKDVKQLCFPRQKPEECSEEMYIEMAGIWPGPTCPVEVGRQEVMRASRPEYLSVPGHQMCLLTYQASATHKEKCIPRYKPQLCTNEAWSQLKEVFKGITCPKRPKILAKHGPPAYLAVAQHQDCITGTHKIGSFTVKCMPVTRPDSCPADSWTQLKELFTGITCPRPQATVSAGPPEYLFVPNHSDCLDTYQASKTHKEFCLPHMKPKKCIPDSWTQMLEVFNGIRCPKQSFLLGGESTHPPSYLSVEDHKSCLSSYQASATHKELCMPQSRPSPDCPLETWNELKEVFKGVQCPPIVQVSLNAGPPAYLTVDGYQKCTGKQQANVGTHQEICLLPNKPDDCLQESYDQLQEIFGPAFCRPQLSGGLRAGPPAYLQVEGHKECLGKQQSAHGTHEEVCMLIAKPAGCDQAAFDQLKDLFDETCRIGGIGGLPPSYLSVEGHQECLDKQDMGTHQELCIPHVKPQACNQDSFDKLQEVFNGETCSVPLVLGGAASLPPAYLSVEGHRSCLGRQQGQGGLHTEYCLLFRKPVDCAQEAFDKLNEVFEGDHCKQQLLGGPGVLPPAHLSVVGHRQCLGSQTAPSGTHTEFCLLNTKPLGCKQDAFDKLKIVFQGSPCKDQQVGGIGGRPPAYLKIDGYQKCLGKQIGSGGTHVEYCTLEIKPEDCDQEAFELLNAVFDGSPCAGEQPPVVGGFSGPLPYPHHEVEGHEACLDTHMSVGGVGSEVCMPVEKPEGCDAKTFEKLTEVFTGNLCVKQNGLGLGLAPPAYLTIAGFEECLGTQEAGLHKEYCLLHSKPENCPSSIFDEIREVFDGESCYDQIIFDSFESLNGKPKLGATPPPYLRIPGFKDCLETQVSHGSSHNELCLPVSAPSNCNQDAFEELWDLVGLGLWKAETCKVKVGALPPSYLQVEGASDCLGTTEAGTHNEVCVPANLPPGCSVESHKQLLDTVFNRKKVVSAGPPAYLGVDGHEKCLQTQPAPSGSHNEKCMPSSKPSGCDEHVWIILKNVFKNDCSFDDVIREASFPSPAGLIIGPITDDPNNYPFRDCNPSGRSGCSANEFCSRLASSQGVCAPVRSCSRSSDCPKIGQIHSGITSGTCRNSRCVYDGAIAIA